MRRRTVELLQRIAVTGTDVQRRIAPTFECIEVGAHYVINKDVVSHLFGSTTNDGTLSCKQLLDNIAQRMLCQFAIRLAIHIGITERRVLQAILASIVAHIPFPSNSTDVTRSLWTQRRILCNRKALNTHLSIERIAARSEHDFANGSANAAIQHIQKTAHMHISICQRSLARQNRFTLSHMMAHQVRTFQQEQVSQFSITDIHVVETCTRVNRLARPIQQCINYEHIMTSIQIGSCEMGADKACTTSNRYLHKIFSLLIEC